ncbi:hypothetical protein FA13DRAFT_1802470 [Coprinellus micaceus]|uniref:Uncharacterized protein n=1 Tax=Coprinellus micaceus TaxID=71717 RepID=A0A4Y7SC69_COPMI|nr:hypothetical protein FA13DRAFT_1802470 [Coprinellus micaceus]
MNTASAMEDTPMSHPQGGPITESQDAVLHGAEGFTAGPEDSDDEPVDGFHVVFTFTLGPISPERHSVQAGLFDEAFLVACNIGRFHPNQDVDSSLDLLFRLGSDLGDGITQAQFGEIFQQCASCHNLIFVNKSHTHRCDAPALLTEVPRFDLTAALNSSACIENPGLSLPAARQLLTRCSLCERICRRDSITYHDCLE